jgi:hypothetical protein
MKHARSDYDDQIICVKSLKKIMDQLEVISKYLHEQDLNSTHKKNSPAYELHHNANEAVGSIKDLLDGDKIGRDEPVFLLRAQDQLAGKAVRQWAHGLESTSAKNASMMAMYAIRHAEKMEHWKPRKLPDMTDNL